MKLIKACALATLALSFAGCSNTSKETFTPDFSLYPFCIDAQKPSVVFVDIKSGERVSNKYNGAYPFYNELAIVNTDKGWTYINDSFKEPINDYFKDATHFSEGVAYTVKPGEQIKAINENGQTLHTLDNVECVYALSEGRSVYKDENNLYGILDKNGEIVCTAKYNDCEKLVKDGTLMVATKEKKGKTLWGIVDRDGEILIPVKYSKITRHNSGFTIHKDNRHTSWYDLESNTVSNYDFYDIVKDGKLFSFRGKNGKYGWMTHKGKVVIEPEFDEVNLFGNGDRTFVKMKKRGKEWGIIDKNGEWITRPRYTSVKLTDKYPIVGNNHGEYGVIDYDGKVLIKTNKCSIVHIKDEYYLIMDYGGMSGIMKADGKEEWTVNPIYNLHKGIVYRPSIMVKSDFINISGICEILHNETDNLTKTNVSDVMEAYKINKDDLPKKVTNLILCEYKENNYNIKVEADKISAWSVKRDFWEGNTLIFNGQGEIKKYLVTISLKNKYAKDKDRIIEAVKKEWGMDDNGTATINNKKYKLSDSSTKSQTSFKIAITIED